MKDKVFTVRGSHGNISVDMATGEVNTIEVFDGSSSEYSDIIRFNLDTLPDVEVQCEM